MFPHVKFMFFSHFNVFLNSSSSHVENVGKESRAFQVIEWFDDEAVCSDPAGKETWDESASCVSDQSLLTCRPSHSALISRSCRIRQTGRCRRWWGPAWCTWRQSSRSTSGSFSTTHSEPGANSSHWIVLYHWVLN